MQNLIEISELVYFRRLRDLGIKIYIEKEDWEKHKDFLKEKTLKEAFKKLSEQTGVKVETIKARIRKHGYTKEEALRKHSRSVKYFYDGIPLRQYCIREGINYHRVKSRLRIGWSMRDALSHNGDEPLIHHRKRWASIVNHKRAIVGRGVGKESHVTSDGVANVKKWMPSADGDYKAFETLKEDYNEL